MTRAPILLFRPAAAFAALGLAVPLAAQQQSPESFSLPEPTPTPTPAPAGPADERAGVAIPPRAVETPRIAPAPMLTPEPSPAPRPLAVPQPTTRRVAPPITAAPQAAPSPDASPPDVVDPSTRETPPGFAGLEQPVSPTAAAPAPSSALGKQVFRWAWLGGAGALLVLVLAGLAAWRRRRPGVLRLAAPPTTTGDPALLSALPRIDLTFEITGATRSMMMFKLNYRLNLANRSDRAVNDLAVAVQLVSAQTGRNNAAPVAAARHLAQVERIGPHQSRSVSGEVQMPLSAIVPIMQGQTPLFIPLVHVTLKGEGQQTLARSFVIGNPSGGSDGRVQPLNLQQTPGSLPGLKARAIAAPAD